MTDLRPVQVLPVEQAVAGGEVHKVPVYDASCAGCPLEPSCRDRGSHQDFRVDAVIGTPRPCRKTGSHLIACRATPLAAALPPPPAPAPLARVERKEAPLAWYLVDASVFINAGRWKWEQCMLVLERAGLKYALATTQVVRDELHHNFQLPRSLEVVEVGALDQELMDLAFQNRYPDGRQASNQDLSLVQAVLEDARFRGILTEDNGLHALHPASFIEKRLGRKIEVLNCSEFRARHQKYFRGP